MASADGSFIAASPPPPGVTPDFANPESIAYRLFIPAILFSVLSLVFVLARLFSAFHILKKWHPDDFLILTAWFIALANSIVAMVQTKYGLGKHIWDISLQDFEMFLKIGMIAGLLTYNLATLFIKASILNFYLRFSIDRPFRFAVYFVLLVTIGYTVPNAILVLYACRPMYAYWYIPAQATATCVNLNAVFHTANGINMITDFAILLLPIWMLRPMHVPLSQKIGVALILMAGGFVCAVSLMRMITALIGINDPDMTVHYTDNLIWWIVEMNFGIICACLPCLKALVKRYFPNAPFFDPQLDQNIRSLSLSSFRLSAIRNRRVAGQPHTEDSYGYDTRAETFNQPAFHESDKGGNAGMNGTTVLRPKPSGGTETTEEHELQMWAGKDAAPRNVNASTVVPSEHTQSSVRD